MSDFKAKMHQNRFPLGLRRDTAGGAYTALPRPQPIVVYNGPTSKVLRGGRERGGEGKRGRGCRRGKGERKMRGERREGEGVAREKCEVQGRGQKFVLGV